MLRNTLSRLMLIFLVAVPLGACSFLQNLTHSPEDDVQFEKHTGALDELLNLPPAQKKIYVAIYQFADQTGQHKPNDNYTDYSTAVTQGSASILINALTRAGTGSWFSVLDRTSLNSVLQERQLIRINREQYLGQDGQALKPLDPLHNAGILLEGGIIGYDSNVNTGGLGAQYLGIGGDTEYRRDLVTVYLRAVSVTTGEVLKSVTTSKTIYSIALNTNLYRYVAFAKLLQIEGGITTNEPVELAVKQAIEKAVYALIVEGAESSLWQFQDPAAQKSTIDNYKAEQEADETSSVLGLVKCTGDKCS
jgi:curli production assembly/transport component CsgG